MRSFAFTPILFVVALAGMIAAHQKTDPEIARGKQIYADLHCSVCHSIAGKGNPKGPHDGVGSKLKPEEIRKWLVEPAEMAARSGATRKPPMIPFNHLKPEELDALVAYLSSLKTR